MWDMRNTVDYLDRENGQATNFDKFKQSADRSRSHPTNPVTFSTPFVSLILYLLLFDKDLFEPYQNI